MKALAMELPVVTTRIVGVPEPVEDGTNGLLVPPGSVIVWSRGSSARPDERHPMGRAARQKIQRDYDVALGGAHARRPESRAGPAVHG
jgi:glycosyltransferase involved in cell wall biosynthesis